MGSKWLGVWTLWGTKSQKYQGIKKKKKKCPELPEASNKWQYKINTVKKMGKLGGKKEQEEEEKEEENFRSLVRVFANSLLNPQLQ